MTAAWLPAAVNLLALLLASAWGQAADPAEIEVVHIVSLCHLDAGYKYSYVAEVASEWIKHWIPESIALSEELRAEKGEVQHRWTMNPYMASLLLQCPNAQWWGDDDGERPSFPLHCPNASELATFKAAVQQGDINFYASNFCTVYEYADANLVEFLSEHAHSIGDLAGQQHRSFVASQRDEPGITRAAIPLLVKKGVTAISVGVDWASPPAKVPNAFVWRDEATGTELLVAWHNYGYGGGHSGRSGSWPGPYPPEANDTGIPPSASGPQLCQSAPPEGSGQQYCNSTLTVPGLKHALALFVQDDNQGPPTRAQLTHYYSEVHRMFPNVKHVQSSTFEEFFVELDKVRHALPIVTHEIGDTWIDEVPSDPLLAAQFRALMRARTRCVKEQPDLCNATDTSSAFYNFSRFLIKNVEHDFGLGRGYYDKWSNAELRASLADCHVNMTSSHQCQSVISWKDQRAWGTTMAIDALRMVQHPLLASVEEELAMLVPHLPDPLGLGLEPVPQNSWRDARALCGGAVSASFDEAAAVSWLSVAGGEVFANASHLLAEPVVHVSSQAQRKEWARAYMADTAADREFFKTTDPLGDGVGYRPRVDGMWSDSSGIVLMRMKLPAHVISDYGGAEELWQEYHFKVQEGGCSIQVTFFAFNKTATRTTESWWMRFHPASGAHLDPRAMRLDKLGSLVSPVDVVFNGSKSLHGVSSGITYGNTLGDPMSFSVDSLDAPVVKVGAGNASLAASALLDGLNPAPLPIDRDPDLDAGFAFNLQNNLWNTNAIEWYPYDEQGRNMKFRFNVHVPISGLSVAFV